MEVKKNPRADVGRNSSLFFAVGLNIMLLLTYFGFEYKTYDKTLTESDILMLSEQLEEDIDDKMRQEHLSVLLLIIKHLKIKRLQFVIETQCSRKELQLINYLDI